MSYKTVDDIRQFFKDELAAKRFTTDKTGAKTIEIFAANFRADKPAIFGVPSLDYIAAELDWYDSMSTNINDIYGPAKQPPAAWQYSANNHGEINSNYGKLIYHPMYHSQYYMALDELLRNNDSRRACMVYNRPSIWTEYSDDLGKSDFICTNAVTYYIRDKMLHAVVQMRSNDAIYGYKNDYAWQSKVMDDLIRDFNDKTLGSLISKGALYWQVQNLHIYEKHFDLIV